MNISEWITTLGFDPRKILTHIELGYMLADDWVYFDLETKKRINKVPTGVGMAICRISQELALNRETMAIFDYVKSDSWSRQMYRKYLPVLADEFFEETKGGNLNE